MINAYKNPASTVDLVILCEEGIVLIKRKNEPFRGYWALPGGFLENGKETLEEAASRELFEETNLTANPRELKLIGVYSNPRRDPRGHVISHAYEVINYSGKLKAKDDAEDIETFRILPSRLAFDHKKILENYFRYKQIGGRR
jgi:8-oxo-dGTP diphosphatase